MKDSKRLPQMIVLGVLVAACVGFIVMKVAGKKPEAPQAATQPAQPPAARSATTEPAAAPTPEAKLAGEPTARVSAVTVTARRDPFAPGMNVSVQVASTPPSARLAHRTPPPFNGGQGYLPPWMGAGPSTSGTTTSGPDTDTPRVESFPPFVLTGVITGRSNVAIIRLGEGRYIVREGQLINGLYEVARVGQDGVVLNHGGRTVFLKLGGVANAS